MTMNNQFSPLSLAHQIEANSGESGLPPVEQWNPEFCGDIDMNIARDGQWYYMGSPIGRDSLVRMFSTILRKEGDKYYLVTPVEKIGIQVEDVPFIITRIAEESDGTIIFLTNTGDQIPLDAEHPLIVLQGDNDEPRPYLTVRGGMQGRLHRNLFYQLISAAAEKEMNGVMHLGLFSAGQFWSLGELPEE